MINADKCFPSLAAGTWTSFCSVLMVDKFHSVVWSQSSWPQQNTLAFYRKCTHNKSKPFLVKPNLETSIRNREAQGSSSSIKCFDLPPQVDTQGACPFWLQILSSDGEGITHSPACFSIKTTSWAGAIRAKLICVVSACTRVTYSRGLPVNLHAPAPFAQIVQAYLRRDLCVGIL